MQEHAGNAEAERGDRGGIMPLGPCAMNRGVRSREESPGRLP